MITREILERTVHIRCTEYAAGFIFEREESRYLVTAEHVVRDYREKSVDIIPIRCDYAVTHMP